MAVGKHSVASFSNVHIAPLIVYTPQNETLSICWTFKLLKAPISGVALVGGQTIEPQNLD
jgi:hypothetical protein